ncbi:MAG: hypothetical protein FD180_538, partial [Planctomycetota bacterium]
FGVTGVPCMILISPDGKEIGRGSGKPPPGQFAAYFVNKRWNDMVDAEKAKNWKQAAADAFVLLTWFPGTEASARASQIQKSHEGEAEFKSAYEDLKVGLERALMLSKGNWLVTNKKKAEAIEAFKALLEAHPESKEAVTAKAMLKKLGVKLEEPAKK